MPAAPLPLLKSLVMLQGLAGMPLASIAYLEGLRMDPDKVSAAATVWKQMARHLDGPVKTLNDIPAASRRGWIADDQREFSRVTGHMHAGAEALRDSLDKVGEILEGVANAFRLFKQATTAYQLTIIAGCTYGMAMLVMSPVGAAQGRLYLRWLANAADRAVALSAAALLTYVMGQTAIVSYLMDQGFQLDKLAESYNDDGRPGARLRGVDFSKAEIDVSANPTFQSPDQGEKLPSGLEGFEWVAPVKPRD